MARFVRLTSSTIPAHPSASAAEGWGSWGAIKISGPDMARFIQLNLITALFSKERLHFDSTTKDGDR